ncbi:nuclear transcription factor Y subunit B-8-like [Arachis hypogaea]|uniref:nuclear transcription factor Y subunit B-8-like n=1 Tax=Arachis hypogaea TaxID=3818 RepID=UPI003B223138
MSDNIVSSTQTFNIKYNNTITFSSSGISSSSSHHHNHQDYGVIKEQDRLLPIANVGRIMKQILPTNAKISKEAKETMQECVSEFISFVTGEASDKCHKEKRKTVNGDDICWALATLGFDDYAEPLKSRRTRHYTYLFVVRVSSLRSQGKTAARRGDGMTKIGKTCRNLPPHLQGSSVLVAAATPSTQGVASICSPLMEVPSSVHYRGSALLVFFHRRRCLCSAH